MSPLAKHQIESERMPPPLGARADERGTWFRTVCGGGKTVAVRLFDPRGSQLGTHLLAPVEGRDEFAVHVPGVAVGALYKLVLEPGTPEEKELPDPYARFLPQGVMGPAMVVSTERTWKHQAVARPLREHVIYELHVGTFTKQGTYAAAQERLPALAELGVTAIELMPLAAFAGSRGWGYDGVAHFAPFAPYGTVEELATFIDAAHGLGLSVFLDVVYNHFGAAGNFLSALRPDFFTNKFRNAWGDAPNFEYPPMRRHVLDNASYWLNELRFDGLRLDATHTIADPSPRHILSELADLVQGLRPAKLLIAEDDRNDPGLVTSTGLDGLWADDFHHALRVTLTGQRDGYFAAYKPGAETIASTIRQGWLFEGQNYPLTGRPRGKKAGALPAEAFVYCIQNHDQVGNRAFGDRLHHGMRPELYQAASMVLLFLPMTPMLFMGQEWAASAPFLYFTDHDPELGRLVTEGRREEFKRFTSFADPNVRERIPDPQANETFTRSRLDWDERSLPVHKDVLAFYRSCLKLRRTDSVLSDGQRQRLDTDTDGALLAVRRWKGNDVRVLLFNTGEEAVPIENRLPSLSNVSVLLASDPALQGALPARLPGGSAVWLAGTSSTPLPSR